MFGKFFSFFFFSVFSLSGCSHLLYAPSNVVYDLPQQHGLKYEEISISVTSERKVVGWYFQGSADAQTRSQEQSQTPVDSRRPLWIFFHGNGENLSSHYRALLWVLDQGYDFFIFDYEGYGPSVGKPTPQSTVEDGLAVFQYWDQRLPQGKKIIFGQSLGGAVALRSWLEGCKNQKLNLASYRALILESTFSSYKDAAASVLSQRWWTTWLQPLGRLLISDSYAPSSLVVSLQNEVESTCLNLQKLIIHGTADPIVKYQLGLELYQELPEPKKMLTIEGGGHINSFFVENGKYQKTVLDWLKDAL